IATPIVKLSDKKLNTVYEPSEDSYSFNNGIKKIITFIAIDINPDAQRATRRISLINSVDVDVFQTNLLDCIRIKYTFDIILFNPQVVKKDGRQVMEQIFIIISKILSDAGLFYLVVIKENDPAYILSSDEIVHERKVRGQHLYVLRLRKENKKLVLQVRDIAQDILKNFNFIVTERKYHFSDCI
ncbi:HEMK2 methyltransferase, partial [Acromyrmex insinuator]